MPSVWENKYLRKNSKEKVCMGDGKFLSGTKNGTPIIFL